MLEVFVHRSPSGFKTQELGDIEELEEQLKKLDTFEPLNENEEITMEVKGPWWIIRLLLQQPLLKDIWFDPLKVKRRRRNKRQMKSLNNSNADS
jgi:hypothetical protein